MKAISAAFLLSKAIVSHIIPILNIAGRKADLLKMEVAELNDMMKIYEKRNEVICDEMEFKNSMIDKFNQWLLSLQAVLNGYNFLSKENEVNSDTLKLLVKAIDDLTYAI